MVNWKAGIMNDNLITVRIAVAVSEDGSWYAVGDSQSSDDNKMAFLREHAPSPVREVYFVEAEVPAPTPVPSVISGALVPV